jgi:ABC-2 type transport system ATP-binding protein
MGEGASPAVRLEGLVKVYGTGRRALDGVDLSIPQGEIFGLIGPNGAGKSTTIRVLATLLKPTGGTAQVLGHDVVKDPMEIRRIIAYLPEDAGAYERLSGLEYLRFMGGFYQGDGEAMLALGKTIAGLGERIDSKVGEYSNGMRRRLLIARTLMTSPRLAILDEPTSGLDVLHAHHVRHQVRETIRRTGATAIVTSHNMLEIEFLCDRVAFIDRGRILGEGAPAALKERFGKPNLEDVFLEMAAHG